MKNSIQLPKVDKKGEMYISYSQITLWKRSRREYIRQYFFGEDSTNEMLQKYGDFGSKVGEALENNDYSEFKEADDRKFLKKMPRLDIFEKEIRLEFEGFYVKGFIDSCSKSFEHIIDYKTGDIDKKVADYASDDYIQVALYAAAIKQMHKVAPARGEVILIGRDGNAFKGEELTLNGDMRHIDLDVSEGRLAEVTQEVLTITKEISEYYKAYLKLNELI